MLRRLAGFVLLFLLPLLSRAVPVSAYEAHVLRYAHTLGINTLNPWFGTSLNILTLSELTAAYFTRVDARGDPIPELVTVIPTKANSGISAD